MPLTDEDLLQAIRAQILAQTRGGSGINVVQNNESRQRKRQEESGGYDSIASGMTPEDLDYLVDIERRDVFEGEEKVGWDKKVHRYTQKKGDTPRPKGKKPSGSS